MQTVAIVALVIAAVASTASFLDVNSAQVAGPFLQIAMGLLLAVSLFRASSGPAEPITGAELTGHGSARNESKGAAS